MNSFGYIYQGTVLLLQRKEFWPTLLVPLMISIIFWFIFLVFILSAIPAGIVSSFFLPGLPILIAFLVALMMFIIFTFSFNSFLNLILCLFNTKLAKKIMTLRGINTPKVELDFKSVFKIELLKFAIGIPFFIVSWALTSFVPGGFLLSGFVIGFYFTFQYADYAQEILLKSWKERIQFSKEHFFDYVLTGFFMAPILSIPIINFIAIPWAISVSTVLVSEKTTKQKRLA